jgi:predicted  nucleic acid-binding Zn-ribbon protein
MPHDPKCRTCGERYAEGGDGFDGECPSCADISYQSEERASRKAARAHIVPKPDTFVIESVTEEGYWSNEDGWGDLSTATVFTKEETGGPLPMSAGRDARWVLHAEALADPVECL